MQNNCENHWVTVHLTLVVILAGILFSGCLGTNPVTPTRFYVLTPAQYDNRLVSKTKGGNSQAPKISLEIAALRLPQYLEKPQIVTRTSENQLELAEYHQWGGNLRKNMTRVFARNMSILLSTPHVSVTPFHPSTPSDFRIEVDVMQFEADSTGQVILSAQWRLFRGRSGKPLSTRISDLKSPELKAPMDVGQTVTAMGELLGEFCVILGQEILIHVQETKAP